MDFVLGLELLFGSGQGYGEGLGNKHYESPHKGRSTGICVCVYPFVYTIFTPKSSNKAQKTLSCLNQNGDNAQQQPACLLSGQWLQYLSFFSHNNVTHVPGSVWPTGRRGHGNREADSRGSFSETRAPELQPWERARNISCDSSKNRLEPCCRVKAYYPEVKSSSLFHLWSLE